MDEKMNALLNCFRKISEKLEELGEVIDDCDRLGVHIIGVTPPRQYVYTQQARVHIDNGVLDLFHAGNGQGICETEACEMSDGRTYPGDVAFDLNGVQVMQLKTEDGKIAGVKSDV